MHLLKCTWACLGTAQKEEEYNVCLTAPFRKLPDVSKQHLLTCVKVWNHVDPQVELPVNGTAQT